MINCFSHIVLCTKTGNKQADELSLEISEWLRSRGVQVSRMDNRVEGRNLELDSKNPDLILVLGGDGTMLSVARKTGLNGIPFLGINMGQVGFLADISPHEWQKQLQSILQGKYYLSRRVLLDFSVIREEQVVFQGEAVNELVVNRSGMARLNRFDLQVDCGPIQKMRADGLIVSTPTGSTAYNVSAGGPLVWPEMDAFILTAICPFLQNFPPLVLSSDARVQVNISESNSGMYITVDGQGGHELVSGDILHIRKASKKINIMAAGSDYFMSKLRERGFLT
ncbi:MAG: NAD(+)/NADH kinase [Thermodesulfobacteriota bacterium]